MSFQSISDLNGAIASLSDWDQKISCEFFEIKMKTFRKSMKHKIYNVIQNPVVKGTVCGVFPQIVTFQIDRASAFSNFRMESKIRFP